MKIEPRELKGRWFGLEPLSESHFSELYQIAEEDEIWQYTMDFAKGIGFEKWFQSALNEFNAGVILPYAVRDLENQQLVGSSRFYNIVHHHRRLAIGHTWFHPKSWGTECNPECKLLMLKYAFDSLKALRVEFLTDARNAHSQSALKKLGATEEAYLERHMIVQDGFIRDSVQFRILDTEWPEIRAALEARLNMHLC